MANAPDGVVVVGAGGHGREICTILQAQGRKVLGFVDDGDPDLELIDRLGTTFLGEVTQVGQLDCVYVLGVGSEQLRRSLSQHLDELGRRPTDVVHPTALVGDDVTWQPGFVAFPNTVVTTNVRFGAHVHLNIAASVSHDCRVGDFVTLSPGARISGNVSIGDGVLVGAGATVLQGLIIGARATIGAGAVVIRDVPAGVTVVGVPAGILRRSNAR